MVVLSYYSRQGGKFYLKNLIKKKIPKDIKIYVEPFFGAGHVFFSIPKVEKEVINDKDKDIYMNLKDIQKITQEDVEKMDFQKSRTRFETLKSQKPKTPKDRFYRFLYLQKNSYASNSRSYIAQRKNFDKQRFIKKLPLIQERLKGVSIHNMDYKKIIEKYDSKDTFFYLDPPYHETDVSGYKHKTIDIEELHNILRNIKGKFLLSYNDHPYIRKIFSDFKMESVQVFYAISKENKTELLISNY